MFSTLTLIFLLSACGQDAIPTSPRGPEQNALVSVVRVQPSAAVIEPDEGVDLSAIVKSARGQTVNGRPVTWTSSDDRVAYVDSQGRIVAGEEGTATITANVLGVTGKATIDVRGTVTAISIDDPLQSLAEGAEAHLTATFVYANGATRPGFGLRWMSTDPNRLWVDGDGDATAFETGDVEVVVRGRGKRGTTRVKIGKDQVSRIDVRAGATTLEVGEKTEAWAEVLNSRNRRVKRDVVWTSSNNSVLAVTSDGAVTGKSAGAATLSATAAGVVGTLDFTVVAAAGTGSSGGSGTGGSGSGGSGGGGGGSGTGTSSSTAPGLVTDLAIGQREERRIELRFTEVDNGHGWPARYEARYGLATGFDWSEAVVVSKGSCQSPMTGSQIGATRSCWVEGLVAAEDYAFQIVAFRPDGNEYGPLSNVAGARTNDAGILVDVTPSAFQLETGETRTLNAGITDTYGNAMAGTPTWTTTSSTVASVSSNGSSAAVSGEAPGNATIRATFNAVAGGSAATVTQPITSSGGSSGGSTGGTSAPPPSGQHFVADFSSFSSDAALFQAVNISTQNNVHAEPGVGMRYDFQPRPTRCGDQSLGADVSLPQGTKEVWLRFRIRFSANWSNANPNCGSPQPDYKAVLVWLKNQTVGKRFNFKVGTNNTYWSAYGPGFSSNDNVPISVAQPGRGGGNPMPMSSMWDGRWHDVALHFAIRDNDTAVIQASVDGVVLANYVTAHDRAMGFAGDWLNKIDLGANRNLGATELMHIWWDDLQVWVGSDPGGFSFGSPASY